jgi:hypothetical protein
LNWPARESKSTLAVVINDGALLVHEKRKREPAIDVDSANNGLSITRVSRWP